jgi:hypothetical protein
MCFGFGLESFHFCLMLVVTRERVRDSWSRRGLACPHQARITYIVRTTDDEQNQDPQNDPKTDPKNGPKTVPTSIDFIPCLA